MADQELKVIAIAQDFDKAAGEVRKVSDAERQLADDVLSSGTASKEATGAGRKLVDAYEKQTKATNKAKFATSDLTSVLSQINPQLGALVDGMLKSSNIAGQLASQNLFRFQAGLAPPKGCE